MGRGRSGDSSGADLGAGLPAEPGRRRRLSACGSERQRAGGGAAPSDEARSANAGRCPGRSRARGAAQPRAGTGQEPLRPGRQAGSAAAGGGRGHAWRVRGLASPAGRASGGAAGGFGVTLGGSEPRCSDCAPRALLAVRGWVWAGARSGRGAQEAGTVPPPVQPWSSCPLHRGEGLVATAGASKEGPVFRSFYTWKDVIPLSAASARQIQVTLCRVFSSFWVVNLKTFFSW